MTAPGEGRDEDQSAAAIRKARELLRKGPAPPQDTPMTSTYPGSALRRQLLEPDRPGKACRAAADDQHIEFHRFERHRLAPCWYIARV